MVVMLQGSWANDIKEGYNNCTASAVCCPQGFHATTGWDPLSGDPPPLPCLLNI